MNGESKSHLLADKTSIDKAEEAARIAAKGIFEGLTARGLKPNGDGYIPFNEPMLAAAMGLAFELAIESVVQVMKGGGVVN